MSAAPAPLAAVAPASVVNNIVTKNLLPEQIQRILNGDDSPVDAGGVICQHVKFTRCSPALQAEKAAAALASAPPEVKAAGRDEILTMLKTTARNINSAVVGRIITRLSLPDEVVSYSDEHIQKARELMLHAYVDCAVCIVDASEFFEKIVAGVYTFTDSRGRLTYRLVVKASGEELQIILRPSDFRGRGKAKKVKVPEALNDILRVRFGIEIDMKSAGDLLALIELHAAPDTLYEEIILKAALRQLLKLPRLSPLSYHGLWCQHGLLYAPAHLVAEVVDALAKHFGNKYAFTKLCRKYGLFAAEPYFRYYTPHDFECKSVNCARAYVLDVSKVAEFLELPPEALCGSQL
jgi:hypothetical protein